MKTNTKLLNIINEKPETKSHITYIVEIGKASVLILGSGNKRQEHNRTPQITNIEKCAS